MADTGRNDQCYCGSALKYKKCCLKHAGKYTVFVDEAGNSGSNYLDLDQPFYLVGGWVIPNARLGEIALITNAAQALNVEGELKGTKLTGKPRNQAILQRLFDKMLELGCKPTMVFAEKKFCIAAKVIETFLDPAYNRKVTNRYTYDNLLKKGLAEKVYRLPFDVLKQFAEAYRLLESESMENSLIKICGALKDAKEYDLADMLSGVLLTIEENTSTEKSAHVNFLPNNATASLNVPAFLNLITIMEKYGRAQQYSLSIIHDKTRVYEPGYKEVYKLFSEAGDFNFELTDGTTIIMGFSHLKEIHFHDSKESPWIQSSDVLISAVNRFLKSVYTEENVNTELLEIGKFVSPAIIDNGFRLGDSICSNETRIKIREAIAKNTLV